MQGGWPFASSVRRFFAAMPPTRRRRIKPVAAQYGADFACPGCLVDFFEDAQFFRCGECPPARTISIAKFMKSPAFNVAGFKGQALTFRSWDHQLRQPVLLATPLMVVSMSPQEGYLSPDYLTDTLGFDKPETECRFPG